VGENARFRPMNQCSHNFGSRGHVFTYHVATAAYDETRSENIIALSVYEYRCN